MRNDTSHNYFEEPQRKKAKGVAIWDFLNRMTVVGIILVLGGLAWILLLPEQRKLNDMADHLKSLQVNLDTETRNVHQLQRELDMLERDHFYISAFARDHLNMCEEGETVFNIQRPGEQGGY